ncbi:hypothetical protein LCGC14_2540060 [marine sediment metagenome]|uniref:Uncharacterized protein n=1 Tax=marine sediment metagenome TaxID=412755 RepID=A0A0F9DJ13_9ZZZZ
MNIERHRQVASLNLYRFHHDLPTAEKVRFVEDLWKRLQKGEIKKKKWEETLKAKIFNTVPQKLLEKWWTPNGITQAFAKNQECLREVKYLHKSMVICRVCEEDNERDMEIMQNLFKQSARSLTDRDIVLKHASSLADNPHRIRVFRNGVTEYFDASKFELFERKI